MSAGAVLNFSGRRTVFANEYCPPTIKLPRLISWKAFKAFYNGGHYSLRGTVFTPTPAQSQSVQAVVSYGKSCSPCVARSLACRRHPYIESTDSVIYVITA